MRFGRLERHNRAGAAVAARTASIGHAVHPYVPVLHPDQATPNCRAALLDRPAGIGHYALL